MLVKELKRLLYRYDDDMEICVGIDFDGTDIDSLCLANIEDGSILSEQDEEDFDKENAVVLIKGIT